MIEPRTGRLRARDTRSAPPDESLVERAVDGDRAAFEELVRRHRKGVVNHLYRLVGRREAALDIAQDVFIKVYQSLASFDATYRFTTWVYRIASNCAIDHLRKKRIATCSLTRTPDDDPQAVPTEASIRGPGPCPHEMLRYREIESRLETALSALATEYRELILLRYQRHCRYDEIARITGLPIGTVKNRIFRARETLRREMADVLEVEA